MVGLRMTRAEKVHANTETLRDAAQLIIVRDGWDRLTFQGLAREAGLTVGAVYARFDTPSDVGIDLWESRLAVAFEQWLTDVVAASDDGDAKALASLCEDGLGSAHERLAAFELTLACLFDEELDEVVGAQSRSTLSPFLTVPRKASAADRHLVASRALVVSFAFGRLIAARNESRPEPLPMDRYESLAKHSSGEFADVDLEPRAAVGWRRIMPDRHPHVEIATAAMDLIAHVGYRRATIARIARRAGVSRGGLLAGYPDKAHLVADAAISLMVPAGEVWESYVAAHGSMSSPEVRALFLRDFLNPERRDDWALNLELNRVARYEEAFAAYAVPRSTLEQTHLGVMVTACFGPDLSRLPYLGCFHAGIAAR
jgi:AcrR family transcriptional regulator